MTAFQCWWVLKTGRERKNKDCQRCGPADGATWNPKRGTRAVEAVLP